LTRKEQSGRPKVNPDVNVGAAERDTVISAMPGKADPGKRDSWVRTVLKVLGPGLITGAADDDPSGIATYSSVGAQYGYSMRCTSGRQLRWRVGLGRKLKTAKAFYGGLQRSEMLKRS
jgi:hypothetical protein